MTANVHLPGHVIEDEHVVTSVRRVLRAGVRGGSRKHDLVQFYAREGGMRTVALRDIIRVR